VRAIIPAEANESIRRALEKHPELDGRVLDLSTILPDDRFFDAYHIGKEGRGKYPFDWPNSSAR
jgi:hypothetical protein